MTTRPKRNGNKIGQWFLTFPQSGNIDKNFILEIWTDYQLLEYAVCKETHEDGNPHLHANVRLRYKITKPELLTKLKKAFPNTYLRITIGGTTQKPREAANGYLSKEMDKNDLFTKFIEKKKWTPRDIKHEIMYGMLDWCERTGAEEHLKWLDVALKYDVEYQEKIKELETHDKKMKDLRMIENVIGKNERLLGHLNRMIRRKLRQMS